MFDTLRTRLALALVPKAATQGLPITSGTSLFGGGGAPPARGTQDILKAYSTMPWLRAVTHKVAKSVGSTTWKLYAVKRQGRERAEFAPFIAKAGYGERKQLLNTLKKDEEVVEIEFNPLLDLLQFGNDQFSGNLALQVTQIHLDLIAEAFWYMSTNGLGVPAQYWPLPPHWVTETPLPGTEAGFQINLGGQAQQTIERQKILWMYEPDPHDPYALSRQGRGSGTARALADELETDEFSAKHIRNWFYNRAMPPFIAAFKGASSDEVQRAKEKWLSEHEGPQRGHRPHFTNVEIDVKELGSSFKDMDLVPLRKYERDTIINVYGVPPELLGIVENSNRATIEAGEFLFARWVLVPRLEFIRSELQEKIVPFFDQRLILDYEDPVQENQELKLEAMKVAPWAPTVNEWREFMSLPTSGDEDGEMHALPINLVFGDYDMAGALPDVEPEPPSDDDDDLEDELIDEPQPEDEIEDSVRALKELKQSADEIEALLRRLRLTPETRRLVQSQIRSAQRETLITSGQATLDELGVGIDFNGTDPRVIQFLRDSSTTRITGLVDETTRDQLRRTLASGVAEGESLQQLRGRIEHTFSVARGVRSETIARTETGRAASEGSIEGMRQGGVERKEWLSTLDDRVRDTHRELDGTIVDLDENFVSSSGAEAQAPLQFGVAEEDINCRCEIIARVSEERSMYPNHEKRLARWKLGQAQQVPFVRRYRTIMRFYFREQEKAILEGLDELEGN